MSELFGPTNSRRSGPHHGLKGGVKMLMMYQDQVSVVSERS